MYAVRRVTDTALRYGILQLTGDPHPYHRSDTDVMSWTITSLRSRGAQQGLGEYHTPPDVCDMMAAVPLGSEPPPKGQWFGEPAGGTGGTFRALAQHLRHLQADPADYGWALNELEPIAAAGAAINSIVWGLGPNVVIAQGDTLGEPDLLQRRFGSVRARSRSGIRSLGTSRWRRPHSKRSHWPTGSSAPKRGECTGLAPLRAVPGQGAAAPDGTNGSAGRS
ncbi:N-6 DNA methylase [Streptomyces sp. MBT84]|uniref:N-6 DNA methylase n=1 Tax=Streptomyces sp. MBT84 TaxID=1488414 RepID=UPI001C6F59AF|nr:N-6 DNA methylase [Streptomyces sp. MBT84]